MRNNIGRAIDNALRGQTIKLNNAIQEEKVAGVKCYKCQEKKELCFLLKDNAE